MQIAVEAYLTDAVTRGVAHATQTTTIFRKQFLAWTRSQGFASLAATVYSLA